jgi:REP element-mobilizing transposase RayT
MPRSARKESGCGIYHVMMRGVNRQAIFDDDEDCRRFMDILADLPFQHDDDGRLLPIRTCVIYAWCLMMNHLHLLVMEKNWKIAEVIKSLASSYVYYYNKKNERIGHLFQERFKSEPCNDMEYFTTLLRYIHQNPVKAGIVEDAADYE